MPAFTNADARRLLSDDRTTCTIPDTFTSIADHAFINYGTFNLLHTVIVPNTITSIGVAAFAWCSSLSSITIPPSVVQIRGYAFAHCSSLKSNTISDAALSNTNYGMYYGNYRDPFYDCTLLIAKARSLNMNVREYLLHRNEMIRLRVTVLTSLKTIQNARELSAETDGREFVWGDGIAIEGGEFDGVLAYTMLNDDVWRVILEYF